MIVLPERLIIGRAEEIISMGGSIRSKGVVTAIEHLGQILASALVAMIGRPSAEPYNRRHDIARIT